ncbi:MAG: translation elongation factor Ts, partial [Pirellulales bacterium]
MAEVTAAAVKELREKTGLPLMECKRALQATGGDAEAAVAELRKAGTKVQETRVGRETTTGRIGIYTDWEQGVGT